jgi:hypothetical protein
LVFIIHDKGIGINSQNLQKYGLIVVQLGVIAQAGMTIYTLLSFGAKNEEH